MSGFELIKRGAGYSWDLGRVLQGVHDLPVIFPFHLWLTVQTEIQLPSSLTVLLWPREELSQSNRSPRTEITVLRWHQGQLTELTQLTQPGQSYRAVAQGPLPVQLPCLSLWGSWSSGSSQVLFAAFWSFPSALGQMRATGLSDVEFGTTSVIKKEGEGLWGNIFIPFLFLWRDKVHQSMWVLIPATVWALFWSSKCLIMETHLCLTPLFQNVL